MKPFVLAAFGAAILSMPAIADDHDWEFRLGVTAHDLSDHIEDGPNITVGLVGPEIDALRIIWTPRPYLYGSFNTNELTNFGGVGLEWDFDITPNLSFQPAFGLSYNDGVRDIDRTAPPNDPNRIRLATTRSLMGEHILFHTTFALNYELSEQMTVAAYYEHISHGQILGSGRNQALDNAGVRFGYRFRTR
jgi:lipid A 3-O-deacylase